MSENFSNEDLNAIKCLAFDENEDGVLDNIVGYKRNAQGRIVEISLDYDGDEMADSKIFFEYDLMGRILKKYTDKNHDGKIDAIVTFSYNDDGSVTKNYDDNADGKIDYVETVNKDGSSVIEDVRDLKQKIKETIQDILKK